VRSHYTREDLQKLFQVQARQAARLLETLPTTKVGTSYLVERDALGGFLERVSDAEDVPALFEAMREEKIAPVRRKLRFLNQRDLDPMSVYGIPEALKLSRGRVEINYATMEELAATLVTLALTLQDDLEEFARLYDPQPPQEVADAATRELRALFDDLREKEAAQEAR
jgi:hypothetical protein